MDIRVQSSGVPCSPAMAAYVRRSVCLGLLQRSDSVDRVEVRLGGAGSGGSRSDSYCLMQIHLGGTSSATVVDIGTDLHATIERAAERAGRLAVAKLEAAKAQPVAGASR